VSLVALGAASEWMIALGYLVASLALGLGAAALGLRLGPRTSRAVAIDMVDE
jgi:fluoride ion exporter CrcB/FEX